MMRIPKPHNLQTRFVIGLILATIALGSVFSAGTYFHMRNVLEKEVQDRAKLIFTQLDSVQSYVRNILRPTMYEQFPAAFVMEAMSSSYISRQIMSPVHAPDNGTIFRRVATNARNPDFEANAFEVNLINRFNSESGSELWQGYRTLDGERYYVMARAVRFGQSCMYCHGSPEDAPADLLKIYGNRGFGKKQGAIAGVDFVATSVHKSAGWVKRTMFTYFAFFAFGALLFFFVTNALFRVLVVNNLKRLNEVFRRNDSDIEATALLRKLELGDEIEELVDGIEQMSAHLVDARAQLHHYAENLRKMVDERTDALSSEIAARQQDVLLFVCLLEDMYKSRSRAELWRYALPQIGNRYDAKRISYLCTMASHGSYVWPETAPPHPPPERFVDMLTGGVCVVDGTSVYVPVESSTGNAEGLLCLEWKTEIRPGSSEVNILQALGRQLGIAAENLTAIDGLARQMNILETIVEGITDPLVLMDANCTVLTANRAARELTVELSDDARNDGNILSLFFSVTSSDCPMRDTVDRGSADLREVGLPCGRTFSLSLYPVQSQSGEVDQVVVYLRETTKEKQMMAQVLHAEKMATVGKLTAGLAHEINNPLGVIRCYTGLLQQSITDLNQLSDLAVIDRHSRQAQRVLQDLLNFARPKTVDLATANVCEVGTSVCEVIAVQAAKKNVRTSLACPEAHLYTHLSIGELEQIISNLMINALDAVQEDAGEIAITIATEPSGMISIEVADNGSGVAENDAPHIFDPFFSTKDIGNGTGLGLTVVYGIVSKAGGRIEIDRSTELGGARFTVFLPATTDRTP